MDGNNGVALGSKYLSTKHLKTINRSIQTKIGNFWGYIFGKVSSVHYQAAHERYWILWRELEEKLYDIFFELEVPFEEIEKEKFQCHEDIDDHINKLKSKLVEKMKGDKSSTAKYGLSVLNHYKILAKDRSLLTRRERHLCTLWQDMTFIRIRLFRDLSIGGAELASYLDYCREEARELRVQDVPEIKETLHEAAVELAGPTSKNNKADASTENANSRTIRGLSTILIRLNSIRLQRIHNQLKIKNTYQWALFCLLPLALILIFSKDFVLMKSGQPVTGYTELWPDFADLSQYNFMERIGIGVILPFYMLGNWAAGLMASNSIFFIFIAGLMGGFLSTVMRLRTQDGIPGEDAFYMWYVLTKPFVGALAASILFVIAHTGIVNFELQTIDLIDDIVIGPIGAKGFTFGFVMGFSERLILPKLN